MFDRIHQRSCDDKEFWDRRYCRIIAAVDVIAAVCACVPNLWNFYKWNNFVLFVLLEKIYVNFNLLYWNQKLDVQSVDYEKIVKDIKNLNKLEAKSVLITKFTALAFFYNKDSWFLRRCLCLALCWNWFESNSFNFQLKRYIFITYYGNWKL